MSLDKKRIRKQVMNISFIIVLRFWSQNYRGGIFW